ncbi:sensor histidine kinase [Streptomyces pseudovenezuelae]|uniref:histidine kinase n=1 Tax=Streptomyces pseudovenezuelae TaxID=67350 RepID=A0ABT6LT18_9ACTN|nr:histidine kinase [Streptomyces pseudovenezuelae]MDH6219473.1 signal transduction histidine kinase [Streptomyces pseudovenezuelae]
MSGYRREKTIDLGIVVLALVLSAALSLVQIRGDLTLSPGLGSGTWPFDRLTFSSPLLLGFTWAINPISLIAVGMLWWRRRRPTAVAVVAIAAATITPAVVPLIVALFTVAALKPPRTILTIALLALLPIPVHFLTSPYVSGVPIANAVILAVLIAAAIGWGLFVRSLSERTERAEAEAVLRAQRAQREAREDIAREMHDVLAHRLSLLSVHAGALEFNAGASVQETSRAAAVIRESSHQALEDLQVVLQVLRSPAAEKAVVADGTTATRPAQTGLAEVPDLVRESQNAGMKVDLDMGRVGPGGGPTGIAGLTAYRIVQEGLTNARKHAHGSPVRVTVTVEGGPGDGLTLELTNPAVRGGARDGIPGAGQGLIGLAERVTLAGGRFSHGKDGAEYVLRAWLPWPA